MDSFKKTMPLIMDLRNPAMRPRHWANLMEVVGATFDPVGPGFTLDSVVKLHLDQHADLIADLSSNASKELAIETSIQACSLSITAACSDNASVILSQIVHAERAPFGMWCSLQHVPSFCRQPETYTS